MPFRYKIGEYVTLKAHIDLYELHEVMPLMVLHRFTDECEAGAQLWYDVRPIEPPVAVAAGTAETRKAKELELVPLDVAAYREAFEKYKRPSWRSLTKSAS